MLTILLGIFIWRFLPKYFEEKAKNIATKEDLKELEIIKNKISHLYNAKSSHEIEFRTNRIKSYEKIISLLGELTQNSVELINETDDDKFKKCAGLFRDKMFSLFYIVLFQKILYFRQDEYEMLMTYCWFYEKYKMQEMSFTNDRNVAIIYFVFLDLLKSSFVKVYLKSFDKVMINDCLANRNIEPGEKKYNKLIDQENIFYLLKDVYSLALDEYKTHKENKNLKLDYQRTIDFNDNKIIFITK